jgi:hypothetical protein
MISGGGTLKVSLRKMFGMALRALMTIKENRTFHP